MIAIIQHMSVSYLEVDGYYIANRISEHFMKHSQSKPLTEVKRLWYLLSLILLHPSVSGCVHFMNKRMLCKKMLAFLQKNQAGGLFLSHSFMLSQCFRGWLSNTQSSLLSYQIIQLFRKLRSEFVVNKNSKRYFIFMVRISTSS